MKTKIFAAAALVLAMLGVAFATTANTQGQVTVLQTCGISLTSGNTMSFGSMNTGDTTQNDNTNTTVHNDGSVNATVYISGVNWNPFMAVSQTHWANATSVSYNNQTALNTSLATFASISNGGNQNGYFKLNIPDGQAAGNYTQSITFTSAC